MDIWKEARERYAEGGITQSELARELQLPLGTLRKRAAQEHWSELRSAGHEGGASARKMRINRQLSLTDRMLDIIEAALTDADELYGYAEFCKSTSGSEFVCERLRFLNDERFARLVKTAVDVFELQRTVLEIHEYKDEVSAQKNRMDVQLAESKLRQQTELAERKLELELLKLERAQETGCVQDDFLFALGLSETGTESPAGTEIDAIE